MVMNKVKYATQISDYLHAYNGKLIYFASSINSVIVVDLELEIIEDVIPIEFERKQLMDRMYRGSAIVDNYLVLIPFDSDEFCFVNLDTKEFFLKNIFTDDKKSMKAKYLKGITSEKDLWCIGENINNILCLSYENEFIVNNSEDYENGVLWVDAFAEQENDVYIPSMNKNKILNINTKDKKIEIIDVNLDNSSGFRDICLLKDEIYLFDHEGNTYKLKKNNVNSEVTCINNSHKIVSKHSYVYNGLIYRFGFLENAIYIQNDRFELVDVITINTPNRKHGTIFNNGIIIKDKCYFQTRFGKLLCFDFIRNNYKEINLCIDESKLKTINSRLIKYHNIINEQEMNLSEYLELISES